MVIYLFVASAALTAFFISNLPSCVPTCSLLQYAAILPNIAVSLIVLAFSIDLLSHGQRSHSRHNALSKVVLFMATFLAKLTISHSTP